MNKKSDNEMNSDWKALEVDWKALEVDWTSLETDWEIPELIWDNQNSAESGYSSQKNNKKTIKKGK